MGLATSFCGAAIARYLSYLLRKLWESCELELAPYGQVIEPLSGCGSALWKHDERGAREREMRVAVVFVRPEDLLRGEDGAPCCEEPGLGRGRGHLQAIARAIRSAGYESPALLVGVVAASRYAGSNSAIAEFDLWARARIAAAVRDSPTAHWLDLDRARALYDVADVHDPFLDDLAHIPFTDEYMAMAATVAARALRALWEPPCKAIVLDCDNTLWGGACGEEPIEALDPSGPYRALREFMLEQSRAGRVLCLASRNRENDVRRAFARCAAPLRWEQIAARRISFGRKSQALRSLVWELGIAYEDLVFVDDDPVECAEVRSALPGVRVVELPYEPAEIPTVLDHVWEFDTLVVTEEDRLRGRSHVLEARRRRERERAPSVEAFVAELQVCVQARCLSDADLPRAVQLLARTNQFNLTAARCSAEQLLRLQARADTEVVIVRVRDKIGDYGMVGVFALAFAEPRASLLLLALSCRVLHRGVEQQILADVARRAREAGCTEIAIAFRDTGRNGTARELLERLADPGGKVGAVDESTGYELALGDLEARVSNLAAR